ncbi:hypothetical protein [Paenibacillus protaetiae]|uniref:Uncharacterized protein n=1 Tax=Paenibacillus protaetiae TaxID=2509456 RepID=A0A4P6FA45_9BACL|nr:hypothetical protein [Paenibacillus protaetiae]QAY67368.1 hypothetical protein ET464_14180 [Paenibacillus protaetiae]
MDEVQAQTAQMQARSWRVGSLSMGVTLLLIGTALALSLVIDAEAYDMLLWVAPLVFIMLGIELLVYVKLSGRAQTMIRFDWLSIFFVAVLGAGSLFAAALSSTGILDEIRNEVMATERSAMIESKPVQVPEGVTKIIVQSFIPLQVETSQLRQVQLLGQVQYRSGKPFDPSSQPLWQANVIGSAMYVTVGTIAHDGGRLSDSGLRSMLSLMVPEGMKVEQR